MPKFRIHAEAYVDEVIEAIDEADALKYANKLGIQDMDTWAEELCPKCEELIYDHYEDYCDGKR